MQSHRRNYPELTRCLEAMCSTGRDNYQLVAVGARGDLPDDVSAMQCVEQRTTEWRHLEYPEFYANISAGHFVVTAAAGHGYEYDKATSTVPTALLLERPLVMSSTLLDAYPCLRKSRVHSMVANDDLCVNLQTAYDLTREEYDEMELEARDCKLEMWRHARETVAGMASGWTLD
ncbi:conserved unknown protein [Ectocarpus siliculosus]|uniref:Uncharacterized protein n=1 Tax=Ectocarpus siliculosus TaxID=2880 RepID=D8LSI3_ECTSI|nr:conserved unknown protein [Ectocarpus siliculosus]|eukprot:CBN77820.1 conserved unknown protein [Ectocarpus siliculosus]